MTTFSSDNLADRVERGEILTGSWNIGATVAIADLLIKVGANETSVNFDFTLQEEHQILFYEGTTVSADGTGITLYNMRRSSATTVVATVHHTPTVSGTGTLISQFYSTFNGRIPLNTFFNNDSGVILDANTNYLIRVLQGSYTSTRNINMFLREVD